MVGRQADLVALSDEDRNFLESQVRRHKAPRSLSDRCRIVLLCAQGLQSKDVTERLAVHEHTVGKWRRRFVQDGIDGLTDEYRAGRPRTVSDAQVADVVERTLNTTPKDATHWSIRSMAADRGLSHTSIRRIWTAFGLPHERLQILSVCVRHTGWHRSGSHDPQAAIFNQWPISFSAIRCTRCIAVSSDSRFRGLSKSLR
jgi:transposase